MEELVPEEVQISGNLFGRKNFFGGRFRASRALIQAMY
jgi:hypothetical protein